MTIQDFIDAIDPTKPVNATATQKPTLKSMRDNNAAIKLALQGLLDAVKPLVIPLSTSTMTGVTPTLVASMTLPASTYPAPTAEFGCGNPAKAATLELRKKDGTVLCTLGGVAGGVDWHTADAGFTLVAATAGDLVLYTNAAAEPAFITSFNF